MKKILGMIPTASIVLAIFTVIFIVWSVYQQQRYKAVCERFDAAVQLEAAGLTPARVKELDGELVCLKGKFTVRTAPVDPMTGFCDPDALVLVRKTEMNQYVIYNDEVLVSFLDSQQKNIVGKNDEFFENPVFPADLNALTLLADVSVGPVVLADAYVQTLTTNYPYLTTDRAFIPVSVETGKDFDNAYGLKARNGVYSSGDPEDPQVGDLRIRYESISASQYENDLFFFGRLSDGVLGGGGIDENAFMTDQCDTFEQVREMVTEESRGNVSGLEVFAAFTGLGAVVVFVLANIANRKRGKNR